jgi:hypothetical protein
LEKLNREWIFIWDASDFYIASRACVSSHPHAKRITPSH